MAIIWIQNFAPVYGYILSTNGVKIKIKPLNTKTILTILIKCPISPRIKYFTNTYTQNLWKNSPLISVSKRSSLKLNIISTVGTTSSTVNL